MLSPGRGAAWVALRAAVAPDNYDNGPEEPEEELDEEIDINLDSSPPPLLNRRMLFDAHEQKSESILGAMLENGCKSYQQNSGNFRPKNQ